MAIQFKELRKYLARNIRLSICFEDGHYHDYLMISDSPASAPASPVPFSAAACSRWQGSYESGHPALPSLMRSGRWRDTYAPSGRTALRHTCR